MIPEYLITVLIGTVGAIIGNIIYYQYRFHKEKKLEFLKMQITDLLLPLYINLKDIESNTAQNNDWDSFLDRIWGDTEIKKISTNKLYLADSKLAHSLLEFLNNQYVVNTSDRHFKSENIKENFEELKQEIFNEYDRKVEEYQKKFRG